MTKLLLSPTWNLSRSKQRAYEEEKEECEAIVVGKKQEK
jgi:hypothetical protein